MPKMNKWIREENLYAWLEYVALRCGYDFDGGDRTAFDYGIRSTDVERDRWFEYSFTGRETCQIFVALDPGSSVVFVGGDFSESLQLDVNILTEISQLYSLSSRRP